MSIANYDEVVEALQLHLEDYLVEQGIVKEIGRNFNCLNPGHEDKTPSMGIAPSKRVAHCFSCSFALNIFQACSILEKKPANGPEFLDTIRYLANKFNIPVVDGAPLTEEQIYELDTYKAYRSAADIIVSGAVSSEFSKAIVERGWTPEICQEFGVGSIPDYEAFKKQLRSLGFNATFLKDVDLLRREIFDVDKMIFTIKNERGIPVGFSSRNLSYTDDKQNGAKYVNQYCTGVKCNIYKKSERLFGFDRVLQKNGKKSKQLYIFEGYADVVTAALHGLDNCVALGGTAFSVDQIQLLKKYGYYDIILCLDADTAGRENTIRILDTILGGHKDLKLQIVIPPDGKDPDQYIREETITKFINLRQWSAFEWRLSQFLEEADPEDVCKRMIPLIVNETSYITKENMCEKLAKRTGVLLKSIQAELNRLQNLKEAEKSRERQNIIDKMTYECKRNPDNTEQIIKLAEDELSELAQKYQEDGFSEDSCLAIINASKQAEEAKDGSFSGFLLGCDLQPLEQALCGNWKQDIWFTIGGKSNAGKSSFLCKLMYSIAIHEENNACVIYHTIDDTTEQILPKFVCIADGSHQLTLNQVMDPNYHKNNIANEHLKNSMLERREQGYEQVKALIKSGKLIIKDSNNGNTLAYADRLIAYYKRKYPTKNIVYVLDNFHKLQDTGVGKDERTKTKELSKIMKGLATKYHILCISTVEYRKFQGMKATDQDIGESIQIEYDANIVAHLHNELHTQKGKAVHIHRDNVDGEEARLPRIEFEITKNKVTAYKETIWFDFWPSSSDFRWVSPQKVMSDASLEKAQVDKDIENDRNVYRECVQEIMDEGKKLGAAYWRYKERTGNEFLPKAWKEEFKDYPNQG